MAVDFKNVAAAHRKLQPNRPSGLLAPGAPEFIQEHIACLANDKILSAWILFSSRQMFLIGQPRKQASPYINAR